jgi:hypothetical protein
LEHTRPTTTLDAKEPVVATLYAPDGRRYVTSDPSEITRLKSAHGYTDQKPGAKRAAADGDGKAPKKPASKSDTK